MKFLKFPAVLAVASCFFINSIANATVKDESELIDAKLPVKVEKQIVKPEAPAQNKKVVVKKESNIPKQKVASQNKKELSKPKVVPIKKEYFRGMELPANYSIEDIVNLYWVEAEREGVRPDIALAQALVETGYFGYGGTVKPKQNNFCGLGTTGKKVKGAKFKSPEIGVRAHIQHLLAYSVMKKPSTNIVDPRYDLAHAIRKERGFIDKWSGLQGTWAMGSQYCEKIMVIYQAMLGMEMSEAEKKELLAKQKLAQEQHEARLKKDKKYRKQFEQEAKEREKARKQAEKEAKKAKKSKDK